MKPLHIYRHIDCEGPGYLLEVLEYEKIPCRLIAIDQGEAPPRNIEECSGLVFMGGSMSVNDPLPWIEQELALIRMAQNEGKPILGHCLGGQLICKALGGTVTRMKDREIGWHPVRSCSTASAQRWLAGLPAENTLYHWHGERFSIPKGAERILENASCRNQAFVIGNTLALQCHVEMTVDMVREWAMRYANELDDPAASVQSVEQMTANLEEKIASAQHVADVLYKHWLQGLDG